MTESPSAAEPPASDGWMSLVAAAEVMQLPLRTVQRSLMQDARREREWGSEGEGWRLKPLRARKIYEVRASLVLQKAAETAK